MKVATQLVDGFKTLHRRLTMGSAKLRRDCGED